MRYLARDYARRQLAAADAARMGAAHDESAYMQWRRAQARVGGL